MAPRLQIKMLSNRGELLNCINCFPGQITVFRAFSDQELLPYQRALSGRHGAEKFSILLDSKEYLPHEQCLIGFGERLPVDQTIEQHLTLSGVPEGAVSGLLVSYGLDEYSGRSCRDLSECAARRTQILAATFSSAAVLVLNNPFESISAHWKERFAELVLNDTVQKQRITIITRLDYRPQSWIGNELVIRMQVGENIQKTIGFAGGQSDVAQMVNQVRELLKDDKAVQQIIESQKLTAPSEAALSKGTSEAPIESPATPQRVIQSQAVSRENLTSKYERTDSSPLQGKPSTSLLTSGASIRGRKLLSSRQAAFGIAALAMVLLVGGKLLFGGERDGAQVSGLTGTLPHKHPSATPAEVAVQNPPPSTPIEAIVKATPVEVVKLPDTPEIAPPPPTPSEMLFDHYPGEIKVALLTAFAAEGQPSEASSTGRQDLEIKKSSKEVNPFEALRGLSGGGISSKSGPPSRTIPREFQVPSMDAPPSESDIERHERIRQKFLDAINRAVEDKQAGNQ